MHQGVPAPREGIERRQAFELPELRVRLIEPQLMRWTCSSRQRHQGSFPERINAPVQVGGAALRCHTRFGLAGDASTACAMLAPCAS